MTAQRTIVIRMTGSDYDGHWMAVPVGTPLRFGRGGPDGGPDPDASFDMVPTGALEWWADSCAEVWVPSDKLALWRMEFEET